MKYLNCYITALIFCFAFASCEIDNYDEPDCTIEGKITDHLDQPFQTNQGAGIIRIREISWDPNGDGSTYIANRTLKVQQDGTYTNTKIFKGTYLLLPYSGAFFPYDDENLDNDDAGELVHIKKKATQDFKVTPYLTLEWVKKPYIDSDGYLMCSVKFKRNQKGSYPMPNLKEAGLQVSRTINAGAGDGNLFTAPMQITNDMEGDEITLRTSIPLKYTGINYWVRVSMNTQAVEGNPDTNYPGIGASNYTTIEQIYVP